MTTGCSGGGSSASYLAFPPATTGTSSPSGVMTISAAAGNGQVRLSWEGIGGATSYDIYRSLSLGVTGSLVASVPVPATSYIDTPLTNGTAYFYTLVARNGGAAVLTSPQVSAVPSAPAAAFSISGTVRYQDKVYSSTGFIAGSQVYKAVRYADVELVTDSGVLSSTTDSNGLFSFATVSAPSAAVYVRVVSSATPPGGTSQVMVKNLAEALYSVASGTFLPGGSSSVDILVASASVGGAFNILDVLTTGFEFDRSLEGAYPPSLTGYWETGNTSGTYYCPAGGGCGNEGIYVQNTATDTDEYDDDVLYHEFGHFTAAHFSLDESPGGVHFLGDDDLDLRLAWSEGWGNAMPGHIKLWLNASDRSSLLSSSGMPLTEYVDTNSSGAGIALDMGSPDGQYFTTYYYAGNEVAVAKILLDIDKAYGMQSIWDVISSYTTTVPATPVNIEAFWDRWVLQGKSLLAASIFAGRQVLYSSDSYEPDNDITLAKPYAVQQTHSLYGYGDLDLVSFSAIAGQQFTISTSGLKNGADTLITILDPSGLPTGSSNDNANGIFYSGQSVPSAFTANQATICQTVGAEYVCHDNGFDILGSRVVFTAPSAGTYYVKVQSSFSPPVSAGHYGTYTLTITSL